MGFDPQTWLNQLYNSSREDEKKNRTLEFIKETQKRAYEKELARKKFQEELDSLKSANPDSSVETSPETLKTLMSAVEGASGDTKRFRQRASMTPKEIVDEYRAMLFDNKPGVLHKINKAFQWLGHDPDKDLPVAMDQYQKNQQRLIEGVKSEDNAAKGLDTASRLRQQAMDKFNSGKVSQQDKVVKYLVDARKLGNTEDEQFYKQYAQQLGLDDKALEEKIRLAAGIAKDDGLAPTLLRPQQLQEGAANTQAQEFAKGIGKNASSWLFKDNPGSPGGIGQNGIQYVPDTNAAGQKVLNAVPKIGRLPGTPKTPATGANVRDRFNQLGGILGNAQLPGIAPQQGGGSPQLPGQTPQPEGIQPGMQPQGQQPRMQSPQATTSPQNRVVDTFLAKKNGNPLLVTDDDIKKAPQLYSTPIQGEQYIIVKNQTPVNPASQAAAGRFGAPAQITFGQPGEKTAAGKTSAEMKSNFISKASDVITALTDAAKEPSKIPGKSVAEATLGGPGTDPKGFISGMFNSDVPNRLPVVSDVAKKIAQLIHTNAFANKNADQTTSSIAAEFNVLLDLYKNDPKAKEFVTRYTQNISQLLSFYTKSITGSQVNQTELQQFAQVIPNLFMDPQTAMRQLVDFSTKISIGQELKSANYSEDQISRVMKNPTFTQFLQEESNKYASEMVRQGKMTSARPGVVNPPVDKNTLLPVNLLGKFMDKYGPEALGGISVKRISSMPGQLNPVEKPIVPSTTNKTLEYLRKRNKAYTGVPE